MYKTLCMNMTSQTKDVEKWVMVLPCSGSPAFIKLLFASLVLLPVLSIIILTVMSLTSYYMWMQTNTGHIGNFGIQRIPHCTYFFFFLSRVYINRAHFEHTIPFLERHTVFHAFCICPYTKQA